MYGSYLFASLFFTFLKGKDPDIIKNTLYENLDADHNDEISFFPGYIVDKG